MTLKMNSPTLADIPDRPTLEQLSRALWSSGVRGAAVLVGAGVTRGGARLVSDDVPLPPLWNDLARAMASELYGAHRADAPRDPLRLAEEFRVGFGDAALADFLRRQIRDDAYEPGKIHLDLLNLPWADVLTTNYDTLLERAVPNAVRAYDVVLTENDLIHSAGRRIIKLHGSLRDGASVVISEEDYRTYPERRAAFVNTARQAFIENELCLLGFSGDDPNFLQWAGWVRDRLGGRARRIYLVGALDLPPIKRRLLEARGVAPIDLAPAVAKESRDHRHAAALSLFLSHLKAARPAQVHDWEPAQRHAYSRTAPDPQMWARNFRDPDRIVEAFRSALTSWREDRRTCPGWIVCPRAVRSAINHGTDSVDNLPLALETLPEQERRDALLELAWRHDRGGHPLPRWLAEKMDAVTTLEALVDVEPELVRTLVTSLLASARALGDREKFAAQAERFDGLATRADLSAIVAHERCLFARDRLDFAFVSENLKKVAGDDPVWGLRRAALLYWVGEHDRARLTMAEAARELRRRTLLDPDSVALRSRFAWARMLAGAIRWEDDGVLFSELDELDRLALPDYEPWDQLRAVEAELGETLRKRLEQKTIEPGFDAGSYRDNRNTIVSGGAGQTTSSHELLYVSDRAGLPARTRHVNVLGTRLSDALRLSFEPTAAWHLALLSTKPSYSKGPIDAHFGRIPVARLGLDAISEIREALEHAINFWRKAVRQGPEFSAVIETLRLYIEALSRIAARGDAETALAHARLAADLACDVQLKHWWLDEPIGHLLKRAVNAVPHDRRHELTRDLLRFPLAAERDVSEQSRNVPFL